ncbi:DUF6588 family protein [Polaribacter glomeratus]|uniref:Outer membrane protein beta-barrel domain-containing protein n=1 Tax=Polaribacter glomeratus TaxID=102 RepID=A0A2S7WYP4_9FLAO|nr:DUF6588 family protein [Polaribacter glomeratus]PQJ82648.1 hypothetical protein BTO16_08710 [Polaribacter glomeratus]TXD64893.1 hypothetical protein ESX12_12155 [Polaribacter glomeratus]
MKKYVLILIGIFALSFNTKAQDGFEGYLLADTDDRSKLIEAYVDPAMKGLIFSMNNGWYHTAKVHKPFGFDIAIGLNASLVPEKDEIFSLSGLTSINAGSITAASVAGSENNTPLTTVNFTENNVTYSTTFSAPGGVKESLPLSAVPAPAVQISMGLPSNFEVSLRVVPKIGSEDVKGNLLGVGLKKEITNWFGPVGKTPLHVSLLAAYTTMTVDYNINATGAVDVQDGLAEFKLNAYTVQAIASLNFPIINIYGGIGYGSGNSTLKMTGDYTLNYNALVSRTITDPIDSSFDAGSFRTTAGLRLSLGFFKLYGSYTLQEYNTANLGVAFSFR